MFRERTRNMSALLRTVAPPPCLPLYIKNWLKEDRILIGCLHTACEAAAATAAGCRVSPPEQLFAPRTLYTGVKKAKLKKS
jgi:hypothetical protein